MKNILRHLRAFILPIIMLFVLPYFIFKFETHFYEQSDKSPELVFIIIGAIFFLGGLLLLIHTVSRFITIGKGTVMPWDPTQNLVVTGVYCHVRNPIILSVIIIQIGEALLLASYGVGLLALLFFIINTVYFKYSEEPGLEKRFGKEYFDYKRNVPRWIPRLKPWHPSNNLKRDIN